MVLLPVEAIDNMLGRAFSCIINPLSPLPAQKSCFYQGFLQGKLTLCETLGKITSKQTVKASQMR